MAHTDNKKPANPENLRVWACVAGRGERIRTSGLYVPNVALYQAKLHPEIESAIVANPTRRARTASIQQALAKPNIQELRLLNSADALHSAKDDGQQGGIVNHVVNQVTCQSVEHGGHGFHAGCVAHAAMVTANRLGHRTHPQTESGCLSQWPETTHLSFSCRVYKLN